MQPLEGLDAAFLSLETPTTPLHVGAVRVVAIKVRNSVSLMGRRT